MGKLNTIFTGGMKVRDKHSTDKHNTQKFQRHYSKGKWPNKIPLI